MKMRKLKVFASLMLATMMTIAGIGSVWGVNADDATGTIIVENNTSETHVSIKDQTFNAYRIFTLKQDSSYKAYDYELNEIYKSCFEAAAGKLDVDDNTTGVQYYVVNSDTSAESASTETLNTSSNDSVRAFMNSALYTWTGNTKAEEASSELLEKFANALKTNLPTTTTEDVPTANGTVSTTEGSTTETATFSNLPLGYYLITGQGTPTDASSNETVIAACMLDTTTWDGSSSYSVTVKIKAGIPTSTKKIGKAPTSVGSLITNDDKSDTDKSSASIGDVVTFKVYSCLPNLTGYTAYTYKMTDTFSNALDLGYYSNETWTPITTAADSGTSADASSAVKVYVEKTESSTSTKSWEEITGDSSSYNWSSTFTPRTANDSAASAKLEITPKAKGNDSGFAYLKELYDQYGAGARLLFVYQAKLNSNAEIARTGNENSAKVTYTNDPGSNSTNDTPDSTVRVYTYNLAVYKYTGEGEDKQALSGAQFLVYSADQVDTTSTEPSLKSDATPITIEKSTTDTSPDKNTPYSVQETEYKESSTSTTTYTAVTSGKDGNILISGLGEGTYYLKEVVAPSGYNLIESLTKVTITNGGYETNEVSSMTIAEDEKSYVDTYSSSTDVTGVKVSIQNNTGSELPSTGAKGTTIIYIVGGILIACAVISTTVRKLAKRD